MKREGKGEEGRQDKKEKEKEETKEEIEGQKTINQREQGRKCRKKMKK